MALPPELKQAIAATGGGRVALVIGAGCSLEAPTNVPLARTCSMEMHDELVTDGILNTGECARPDDLAALAEVVFAKTGSQRDLVSRMRERYGLHARPANEGYLIAAALLCERAVASIVTLNYDVALTNAISELTCADAVGIVEGPQHLADMKGHNIFYLHRSANAPDPETWVLRTQVLRNEWRGKWEQVITNHVLVRPVVIFAGLASSADVILEGTRMLRAAVPGTSRLFQIDPGEHAHSRLAQELGIPEADYARVGWCAFMRELSERLMHAHAGLVTAAATRKATDDGIVVENISEVLGQLRNLGIVTAGKLRAIWFYDRKAYLPMESNTPPLMADLLLGIVLVARLSNSTVTIAADGFAEFHRGALVAAVVVIASGVGHKRLATIEAATNGRKTGWRGRAMQPNAVIVAGVSGVAPSPTPPADVIRGAAAEGDIISGAGQLRYYHVDELRQHPDRVVQVVP